MTSLYFTSSHATLSPAQALSRIAFFGRRLCDYERMFGFTLDELRGKRVLDVGAGSASFVAEATRGGIEAMAVDPVYRLTPFAVRNRALEDFDAVRKAIESRPDIFRTDAFGDEEALWDLRAAARDLFLDDFRAAFPTGRYRAGSLPALELEDSSFDRVVCGHLLFLYGGCLDEHFHLAALRELVRVAREKVVVYPLVTLDGNDYPGIERLRLALLRNGVESALEPVSETVLRGACERLVLYPE